MSGHSKHSSSARDARHVDPAVSEDAAREVLKRGPRGALVIASVCLIALLAGWLAFYFLLFLPRGSIS